MKPLKPSHRERKRYLVIQGKNLSKEIIENAIFDFVGILGYAEASPHYIRISKDKIILSINKESLDKIRASFLINADIRITKVSGSLKKLK